MAKSSSRQTEHLNRRSSQPASLFRLLLNPLPLWTTTLFIMMMTLTTFPAQTSAGTPGTQEARFHRLTYMDDRVVKPESGHMENTLVSQLTQIKSPGHCAAFCLAEERCSSFFYDRVGQACLMHSIVFMSADEASPQTGMTYWKISQDDCPAKDGFILYRPLKLCYKYYAQPVYWNEANATCNGAGTSLIKVSTQDISTHLYQFLRGSIATRSNHICIGASRDTGNFTWPDGSDVTWFNWAKPNEPTGGEEKCVAMAWFYYFSWNDIPCGPNVISKYNFVCQKTL